MPNEEELKKRLEQLRAQREQAIAQVNVLSGYIAAYEELLAPQADAGQATQKAE